jgi:hypothetical protein
MIDLKKVFPRLKETHPNDDPVTLEEQDGGIIFSIGQRRLERYCIGKD